MTFLEHGTGLSGEALNVNGLAFGPGHDIALATKGGLFYAKDGITFADLSDGLPSRVVWSVAIFEGTPSVIIATTDRGVYRRKLPQ